MKKYIFLIGFVLFSKIAFGQTDANIFGDVQHEGKHIAGATVYINGTNYGTLTDQTGHYMLTNLPEGDHILIAKFIGFKDQEKNVNIVADKTIEFNFELEKADFDVDEVVVTGSRTEQSRKESPILVSSIKNETMNAINTLNIGETLNFQPGIRSEINCQTCSYSQIRINGLPGNYSQILINCFCRWWNTKGSNSR